jgi:hypothetical protein
MSNSNTTKFTAITDKKGKLCNCHIIWQKCGITIFRAEIALYRFHSVPRPSVTINGQVVRVSPSLKFLGVILDQELQFKVHVDYAAAKGKYWITQTRRISKSMKGIRSHILRQLYKAVAVPAMMYGASVWLTPIVRSTM